jgi:hypothetical protein
MTDGDFKRDRWGRPLITPPGEDKPIPYIRVSKLAGVTDDTYNLMLWYQRTTALGLVYDPNLFAEVGSIIGGFDDPLNDPIAKKQMKRICAAAHIAGGGEYASKRGSHLHRLTEYADRGEDLPDFTLADDGEPMDTTPEDRETVVAYREALAAAGITPVWIELPVVNDRWHAAGTLDRVFLMPDGAARVADYKTGAHDDKYPSKVCCQVRTYSTAHRYDHETQERLPIHPNLDPSRGLLIHQPDRGDGTCTLYDLNLEAADPIIDAAIAALAARKIGPKALMAPHETVPARGNCVPA